MSDGYDAGTMRVFAGALLAMIAAGPNVPGADGLAVTMTARPLAASCAVRSTATITAYDASTPHGITYRFARSDGSFSPLGRVALSGDGAVAQSVTDTWTPRGTNAWTALEIVTPHRVRSAHVAVTSRCARGVVAATR